MSTRDKTARPDSAQVRSEPVERVKGLLDRWMSRAADHLVIALIRHREGFVVVPADEYEAYLETLDIMDDPDAQAALAEGEADAREGRVRPYEDAQRDLGLA